MGWEKNPPTRDDLDLYPLRIPVANEGFSLEFPSLKLQRSKN